MWFRGFHDQCLCRCMGFPCRKCFMVRQPLWQDIMRRPKACQPCITFAQTGNCPVTLASAESCHSLRPRPDPDWLQVRRLCCLTLNKQLQEDGEDVLAFAAPQGGSQPVRVVADGHSSCVSELWHRRQVRQAAEESQHPAVPRGRCHLMDRSAMNRGRSAFIQLDSHCDVVYHSSHCRCICHIHQILVHP